MGTPGFWWSQAGSNRRPLACHASALPAELWPQRRVQHCSRSAIRAPVESRRLSRPRRFADLTISIRNRRFEGNKRLDAICGPAQAGTGYGALAGNPGDKPGRTFERADMKFVREELSGRKPAPQTLRCHSRRTRTAAHPFGRIYPPAASIPAWLARSCRTCRRPGRDARSLYRQVSQAPFAPTRDTAVPPSGIQPGSRQICVSKHLARHPSPPCPRTGISCARQSFPCR